MAPYAKPIPALIVAETIASCQTLAMSTTPRAPVISVFTEPSDSPESLP